MSSPISISPTRHWSDCAVRHNEMRILGVDPGTLNLGYGVVDVEDELRMVDCGVLNLPSRIPVEERLRSIYAQLSKIIAEHEPDEVAIEEPFVGRNVRSAFAIGRAQAISILAAADVGLPVFYYSPASVKQQVTSYGRSDKQQVWEMVRVQLGLTEAPQPHHAADALAVAICHSRRRLVSQWLAEGA